MTANDMPMNPTEMATMAMSALVRLPYAADGLPGIGGSIKATPDHFVVEEGLPYAACGEGEHVYITFRRSGWNTADAARRMQQCLGLAASDVGWGGRKDKTAVVVQTLSFRCGVKASLPDIKKALEELPFQILAMNRHRNKIKTGHVATNRFIIIVSHPDGGALPRALNIAERLKQTGIPNFYGPQRFGHNMQNIPRAFALLAKSKKMRKDAFLVSALQSVLFNIWLKERMEGEGFQELLAGDVAKKTDTGGMFVVEDPALEKKRFSAGQIVYTGPIYGFKMRAAEKVEGDREMALLDRFGLTVDAFRAFRAPGSRREAILHPADMTITEVEEGLRFAFSLPSGAYATTVMREFIQSPLG